jgi:DNA-binding transcriptional ArsR family regulator
MKNKRNAAGELKPAVLLGNELRVDILAACDQREVTPQEFVDEDSGLTLGNVNYHFNRLAEGGFIYVARTEPTGGSERHYYRSVRQGLVSDDEFEEMKPDKRQVLTDRIVEAISERARAAAQAGTIDRRTNSHLTWDAEWLDPERHDLLMAKLLDLHEFFKQLKEEMQADPSLYAEAIFTTLALMGYESPPEEEKRPKGKPRRARPGEKVRPKPRRRSDDKIWPK